jgi:UDP-N-acetyl-2-amino-2-deoxyglucuronate dehydrogenase
MGEKLGVAIHGAGWVAGEYIKAFSRNPHCEVRVVSSRRESSARARVQETGIAADVETDYGRVLQRRDVDIVAICTPSDLHPAETIAGAEAGKHLVIEKPVALNVADLRRMHVAVQQAGVRTVVGFVLRWNPLFVTVKRLIADGVLGDIFLAETGYLHAVGPWYSGYEWARTKAIGGSTMLFAGCHAVDALRWFAGDIVEVSAYETRGHDQAYEYAPTVAATVKLASGGIGVISASFEVPVPYTFPVQLHGTKGAFRDGRLFSRSSFPGQTGWITIPSIAPDSGDVSHHPFQGEVDHLVECIQTGTESHCNLADAVKTHEVCLAIDQSAAEGRPVRLPLP